MSQTHDNIDALGLNSEIYRHSRIKNNNRSRTTWREGETMKRPDIMWHVPLDAKHSKEDGYWVYVPFWIVRAYRLLDKYGKPMINLNGRIALRIADKGEAPIKYYRRYHNRAKHRYFVQNWSNKLNRERKEAAAREKVR